MVVPLVGVEFPLEGEVTRGEGKAVAQHEGAVGLVVRHIEDLVPAGRGVPGAGVGFGFLGLLGDLDGLEDVLRTGGEYLHVAIADFFIGVVGQSQGNHIVGGLHILDGDPVGLALDVDAGVGHHMGLHQAVLGFAQVVDGLGVGFVGDVGVVGLAFTAEGEFHDGGEANLGVCIGKGATLHHGQRGDGDFAGIHGGLEVGIGEDVHHGGVGLVHHGVGDLDGGEVLHGKLGLGNLQTESGHDGNLDGAVVGEGDDHLAAVGGLLDVLDDAVGHAATAEFTQVGGLAVHGHIEVAVLDFEGRDLVEGEVLAVHLQDFAVDGPAELACGVLDHGKHAGAAAAGGGNMDSVDGAVTVGDGDAVGGLFHLLDISTQGQLLDGRDLGLQVAYLGLERGDPVAKLGVIVLLGTAHQEQSHCKSS